MKIRAHKTLLFLFAAFIFISCRTGPALEEKTDSDASVNVATGAADVDVNTGFLLEFSVAANTASVNNSTFFVVPVVTANASFEFHSSKAAIDTTICNPSNALAGTITPSTSGSCSTTYTLNPSSSLGYETEYALCVTSDISFCNPNVSGFFSGLMEIFTTVAEAATYTVGGTVTGLDGTVVLQNNAADDLTITENGEFTFSTAITDGAEYSVTVKTNPSGQTCTASDNSGTIDGANATDVVVICSTNSYTVGGTVSGLTGTVTLQNNATDDLIISANGSFTFATEVADGADYAVTVKTNPNGQVCAVTNGSGTVSSENVTTVSVTCITTTYTVGGTLSGLDTDSGLEVTLQNNGGDDLTLDTNGSFTFSTKLGAGDAYAVTILTQPDGQTCHMTNGSGIISGDVSNVTVYCAYFAYVTNNSDDTVSVIDTTDDSVFGSAISVGAGPQFIIMKPDGSKVYVANSDDNSVSVIDTATNEVVYTIDSGLNNPRGIDVSPDGTQIYVSNHNSNYVCVYDVTGDPVKVGDNIVLAYSAPLGLAFTPDGSKVYVATYGSPRYASVIDTTTRDLSYINLLNNAAPSDVDFTPDGSLAYITRPWRNSIAKVNTTSQTVVLPEAQIAVDVWPGTLKVAPDGTEVYVSNNGYISVISVSGNNIIDTIIGFSGPSGIDFNYDGSLAYVTNSGSNTVSVVNTTTREIDDTIVVGNAPNQIAIQK